MSQRQPRFGEGQVYTTANHDEPYYFTNALCKNVDPELFFPDERRHQSHRENKQVRDAKEICNQCIHETDCAVYAILRPYIKGVWGSTTTMDRQRIRKENNIVGLPEPTYSTGGSD